MKKNWGALAFCTLVAMYGCTTDRDDELGTKTLAQGKDPQGPNPPPDPGSGAAGAPGQAQANVAGAGPGAAGASGSSASGLIVIDARRSLAVTDQSILERFGFERVMDLLVSQSGVAGLTSTALFQQMWDTQNPGPGGHPGAHCDDDYDPARGTLLNDFPYICRPAPSEGAQASCDPFAVDSDCAYIPIGLFSRFDQAPEDGAHCGEYRIIYAKESGVTDSADRNLIIFEALMPNPQPHLGLKGCQNVVKTWSKLSTMNDPEKRADDLEDFYFDGTGLIPPAIHIDHLGAGPSSGGQIRTNQFMFAGSSNENTGWMLREFKLQKTCTGNSCTALSMVPVTVKTNPSAELFDPALTHSLAAQFQSEFPGQVSSLAADSINGIGWHVSDQYNTGQSAASGPYVSELDFVAAVGLYPTPFKTSIATAAAPHGLTVDNVLDRARTQTCAGCHRRSRDVDLGGDLVWPADLGFVHVSERVTEMVDGDVRYGISDALRDFFLPKRKEIMEDFMNDKPRPPAADPTMPLIGHRHHG